MKRNFTKTVTSACLKLLVDAQHYYKFSDNVKIDFCVTNNQEFNAYAARENNIYQICIYAGVLDGILSGVTELEERIKLRSSPLKDNDYIFGTNYASHIAFLSAMYVFFHELAHIALGHVDLVNNDYGIYKLYEYGDMNTIGYETFQAIEFQADNVALITLREIAFNNTSAYDISLAISLLFNFMAIRNGRDPAAPDFTTHPHPTLRLTQIEKCKYFEENLEDDEWHAGIDTGLGLFVEGGIKKLLLYIRDRYGVFAEKEILEVRIMSSRNVLINSINLFGRLTPLHQIASFVKRVQENEIFDDYNEIRLEWKKQGAVINLFTKEMLHILWSSYNEIEAKFKAKGLLKSTLEYNECLDDDDFEFLFEDIRWLVRISKGRGRIFEKDDNDQYITEEKWVAYCDEVGCTIFEGIPITRIISKEVHAENIRLMKAEFQLAIT